MAMDNEKTKRKSIKHRPLANSYLIYVIAYIIGRYASGYVCSHVAEAFQFWIQPSKDLRKTCLMKLPYPNFKEEYGDSKGHEQNEIRDHESASTIFEHDYVYDENVTVWETPHGAKSTGKSKSGKQKL
jgi:hypothetical protein